jgi:hypothetical protein
VVLDGLPPGVFVTVLQHFESWHDVPELSAKPAALRWRNGIGAR